MRAFAMFVATSATLMIFADLAAAQLVDLQPGRNFPTALTIFGTSRSENVDVADVDNDGDLDVVMANGGDGANQDNTIYINQGGAQGGVLATFMDDTASRFVGIPADRSRDVEFADFDNDCDLDIYITNVGTTVDGGQPSRAYINSGGMQFGSIGFFTEETDAFFGTLISIPAGDQVIGGNTGGWRDFACDCDFADMDLDGDIDLFHSSYGPNISGTRDSRVFMNDGTGVFDELWPWANATADIRAHVMDVDLVDLDSDFDIDVFMSSRDSQPRVFRNNLQADGTFPVDAFTDITQTALLDMGAVLIGTDNYECEFGDVDGDGDFDIWAKNYQNFGDRILRNNGDMTFTKMNGWINGDPNVDENEIDFFDFDGDNDLDGFVANFAGTNWLYVNGLTQGFVGGDLFSRTGTGLYPSQETPTVGNGGTTLDADCADMDNDGDPDILLANDSNQPNRYWQNTLGVPDTHAPTIHMITSQGNKSDGSDTDIRVQLRDNDNYYIIAFYDIDLLYSVDGGIDNRIKMISQGSQQFQATIPGGINGAISWRVVGSDLTGNTFSSTPANYTQTSSGVSVLENIDDGTPGISGNPYLAFQGSFVGGSIIQSLLCDAAPSALAVLFGSLSSTPVAFKGGLLHTVPIAFEAALLSNAGGQLYFEAVWPVGLPTGTQIWFQFGVADAAGTGGATLSNAIVVTTP
jgi:hypothetical protein